ncbi:Wnt-activated receptor [Balamuthia mandrillaris]
MAAPVSLAVGVVFVLLLLLLLPGSLVAQEGTCEPWSGVPKDCTAWGLTEGTMVYVRPDQKLADLEKFVWDYSKAVALGGTPLGCQEAMMWVNCGTNFRRCIEVNGEFYPLPEQKCDNMCRFFQEECDEHSAKLGFPLGATLKYPPNEAPPLDCLEIDFYAQNNSWFPAPNSSVSYDIDGTIVDVPCDEYPILDRGIITGECYPPLVREGIYCGFECPLPAHTEDEYKSLKRMQLAVGWISAIGAALLVLSFAFNPKLRKFPSNLIMKTALSALLAVGGILLPTFADHETFWCSPDGEVLLPTPEVNPDQETSGSGAFDAMLFFAFDSDTLQFDNPLCTFQGFVIHFGLLASTAWWALTALNMTLALLMEHKGERSKFLQIAYYVIGWVVPFVLALLPAVASRVSFAPGATFCFVSSSDNSAFLITFWFIPVGLMLLTGFILFGISILKLVQHGVKSHSVRRFSSTYFRLTSFVGVFFIVYLCIFVYSIVEDANKDTIAEKWDEYFTCLYQTTGENCELSKEASLYSLAFMRGFGVSVLGTLLFFLFLVGKDIPVFWYELVKDVLGGRGLHRVKVVQASQGTTKHSSKGRKATTNSSSNQQNQDKLSEMEMEETNNADEADQEQAM